MNSWCEQKIDWYLRAGEHSQYPSLILEEVLPWLKPEYTVLDIGCGPGVYSLTISPFVKQVLALDKDQHALNALAVQAEERHLNNISCLHQEWPQVNLGHKVDVVIGALGSGKIMTETKSLEVITTLGPQLAFLVAPGKYLPPFGWKQHRPKSAVTGKDTLSLLTQLGVNFNSKAISLDFGQPVKDMAEATEFLARFLKISPDLARGQAHSIARPHSHGLFLPNRRNLILIRLEPPFQT